MANKVTIPDYDMDSLRPNPEAADKSKGKLAFAVPPTLTGDFGGDGASPRVVNGLPAGTDRAGKRRS